MRKNNKRRPAAKKGVTAGSTGRNEASFIVVGVGASAGSQKSLQKLFSKMPTERGVAFVLILHTERGKESLYTRTLKKQTALAVVEAEDGMPVLADRIHIVPPDKFLNITAGRLTLQEPVLCNGLRMPIDHFFCSLAVDQRHRSIAILLSGRGSDGILGLSEIKAAGGQTIVEDPGGAKRPNMSQGAIDAGVAETALPAAGMAEALMNLAEQVAETKSVKASPEIDANIRAILDILRAKIGHDFRCYKPNTIVRRIHRRMGLAKIASLEEYAQFLREHQEEVGLLQKDLLIGVTDFFRQPHAWEYLTEKVIAQFVETAQPGSEIRAWIPGCSTGKEAYSLAILLTEEIEKSGKKINVQIFATDSDLAALATARGGIYSKEDLGENVSQTRLKRFFLRKDGHYQVAKDIREKIVFAPQNITADPPFSRLDLISCRNLLIYMEQQVQKKIIDLFHFSLREGGFLFLGTTETVGDREDLFEPVSKKWRIYQRIGVGHRVGIEIPVSISSEPDQAAVRPQLAAPPSPMSLTLGAQHMLLDRFVPACVMIDRKLHVLYVHGRVEDYITFPPGELTTRIIDMAREGLRARLRGAIAKCLESNKSVAVTARMRRGDKSVPVKAIVSTLRYPREINGLLLITFEDYHMPVAKTRGKVTEESNTQYLMDELKITREELQSTIEQLENSNDQLKASNEEVMATNEELQSANEELETSKEELQSLNEELNTINTRLQEKVDELEDVSDDVVNLLSSTNIATVFLDKDLRVKRYTPAITRLLSLIPSDTGRYMDDILRKFRDDALLDDSRRVLAHLAPISVEVQADDGRWYIRSITPYRTQDDRIEGVVITFVDVGDLKRVEETLHQSEQRYRTVADFTYDWEFWLSPQGRFHYVSPSVERITGRQVSPNVCADELLQQIVHPEDLERRLEHLQAELASQGPGEMEFRILRPDGEVRWMHHICRPIYDADGRFLGTRGSNRDITERKRMEDALREAHERAEWLARFPEENPNPVIRVSTDGSALYCNPASEGLHAWRCEVGEKLPEPLLNLLKKAMTEEQEIEEELEIGGRFYSVAVAPILREGYTNIYGRDTTERRRAEEALQTTLQRLRTLVGSLHSSILLVGDEGRIVFANQAFCDYFELQDSPTELAGITAREMINKVKNAYLHPAEQVNRIMEIVRKGQPVIGEEITMLDGRSCLRDFIPVHIDGRSYGLLWQHTDITERKRAEEALRKSRNMLQAVMGTIPDAIYAKDTQSRLVLVNPASLKTVGKPAEQILGRDDREFYDDPAVAAAILKNDRQVMTTGVAQAFEEKLLTPEGYRDFLDTKTPWRDDEGNIIGIIGISRDITERKEKDDQIAKLTRLYAALSRVNEAIVRIHDEGSLYDEVCQILSEEGNFPLVWIGQVKEKQVIPAAWHGTARDYLKEIKVETEGHFGQGPTGTSIRENRAVINDDFANSPAVSPWRKTAISFGFRSSAAFPLARGGKAVASLTVYSSVAGVFDAEQVRLLESLSADISYALDALSQDKLRRAADEAVRESEERFRLLSSTAGRLLRADDPQAVVEDLCRDVMAYLDCQAFFNFLVDEKAGKLRLNACAGIPEDEARAIEWLDYGIAVCGCVAQIHQRILAEDILHTPDVRTELVKSYGIQAYCCHPLMAQDHLIGTLSFGTKTRAHFTPEEVELMRIVTDQVAVAMQRKQSEETLHRLNAELEERVNERTAELRAASLYSRSLIEASLDPLVTISPEGKITDVNKATEQVTGRTRGELIGTYFSDYFTEPDAARAGYRKVLADSQVRDYPLTIRDASGNTTGVLYNATVYRNAQGEVQGIFAAARDVTETKRVEAELARHREHLEDMVKERTAELEAANKELESFSYSVSHDLRAPLRAIDGYARMIMKKEGDKFDEETLRKFNVIRSSSQMMGQLIDDILTLSRVVKKHLSASQLQIDTIIREVWKELETINPERNMKLTVRDVPVSYGDRTLIRQVYANLLSNAVKFTKDRDPALIETGGYVEGEDETVYYIRDNGVGFEMEYYDKLFGIFQRLHKAEEFEGTGVGLATVQRIVQRHGGRAWAEGKVNEGATFYFTLPRKR
ncbi:MAG TPA: PAS domain-containing protein [Syntrophales bacterium]|nr:PAS domain-containing protein [Syntrophales bacterium]